ncbi:hypothetical protein [Mycobacterium sp. DL440]|uniref:hypothetical protein n=1 Tax=Mycobacterium sp. DL440 TaxID=2675523 RepID=UPI0014239771|nr:hypothetical protein [Mycobacterium sp. DL440]
MTPMGALTLAILAGLAIGVAINWFVRRGSRQQHSRRAQLAAASIMILIAIVTGVKVAFSSTASNFNIILGVAMGVAGVIHLVLALRTKAVQ